MTKNTIRVVWTITGVAALALLALTVTLAIRARSLPVTTAAAPPFVATTPLEELVSAAAPTRVAPAGAASNGLIAFGSDRDGNAEIYVMQPDGSDPQRISDDPTEDRSPFWSLDGSRLVWLRIEQAVDGPPAWSAMSAAPDGSDQSVVISGAGWPIAAAENPVADEAAIYVVEDGNENGEPDLEDQHRLLLIDLASRDAQPVDLLAGQEGVTASPLFSNGVLQWSADGAMLYLLLEAFDDEVGLYALPLAGGPPELVSAGQVEMAVLSPDGKQMAIWRAFKDTGRRQRRLYLYDLVTGLETQFQMGGLAFQTLTDLQWSRDGSQLVFAGFTGSSAPDVFILDVARDELTPVSQRVADPAFTPALSPDGQQIVFAAQPFRAAGQSFEPAGDSNLYLVDDLGSSPSQLTADQANNYDPAWQPLFR